MSSGLRFRVSWWMMALTISICASSSVPISVSKCSVEKKDEKTQDLCGFDGPSALLLDRLPIYQKTMKRSRIEEKKNTLEYKKTEEPQFVVNIMLNIPAA